MLIRSMTDSLQGESVEISGPSPTSPTSSDSPTLALVIPSKDKLTPDLLARLVALVESGVSITGCCKAAGIGRETFVDWYRLDRAFRQAVDGAEGRLEEKWVAILTRNGRRDSKVIQWLMARRLRQDYSEATSVQHNHLHATLPADAVPRLVEARGKNDHLISQAEIVQPCDAGTSVEAVQ